MKKYRIILADAPWYFRNYSADDPHKISNKSRGQQRHYVTMTEEELCKLVIPAEDNAVLFMWTCWPILEQSLRVIKAWGFEYKTIAWIWVKANKKGKGFFTGMGYYTRANSEPCLLATKGRVTKPTDRGVQSVIYAPVRGHSQKPDEQYQKIARLYPEGERLEMFARHRRSGWDVFGNEVAESISL